MGGRFGKYIAPTYGGDNHVGKNIRRRVARGYDAPDVFHTDMTTLPGVHSTYYGD